MDELTFLLILAGIGVILLVAMFTYYKHHKKINDEIKDFNHHAHDIDDVLLTGTVQHDMDTEDELPGSFSASRQDTLDLDDLQFQQNSPQKSWDSVLPSLQESVTDTDTKITNERELVDGVYINSKRVLNSSASQTSAPAVNINSSSPEQRVKSQHETAKTSRKPVQTQTINVVYDAVPDGVRELIISHTILSRGEYFTGRQLFQALESAGLSFGEMNIYHYPGGDEKDTFALFSVANVVEPGTFDPSEPDTLKTPGISMFMRLPTRTSNNEAYEEFIHVAQLIAEELDGELCDETRSQLTQQAISYKKEQIRKLNFDLAKADKLAGTDH